MSAVVMSQRRMVFRGDSFAPASVFAGSLELSGVRRPGLSWHRSGYFLTTRSDQRPVPHGLGRVATTSLPLLALLLAHHRSTRTTKKEAQRQKCCQLGKDVMINCSGIYIESNCPQKFTLGVKKQNLSTRRRLMWACLGWLCRISPRLGGRNLTRSGAALAFKQGLRGLSRS